MAKLIFGCGYLGRRVARKWHAAGQRVFVVTRSDARAREFAQLGYVPIVADVTRPQTLVRLPAAETVLYAVGYDRAAGPTMREVYVEGLRAVLDALPPETRKLVYISSSGVYAQSDGQWVDEDSTCQPTREGGRACLAAEQLLAAHPLGSRAVVLRMAGLYGPGRIPNAGDLRRGRSIAAAEHGYLNLIHVDDAAEVVLAAEAQAQAPRTYVVSDGHPVERQAYYAELARLLGAPPPRFEPPAPDSPRTSRAASSKRLDTARLVSELCPRLAYPSFREGLAAIVTAETAGPD
jgi:nucleoside-diphosphate-sugar epimerase